MQIGITQLIAPDMSLAQFFSVAANAGYEVVELAPRREGELTPETSADDLQAIVQQARDANLRIVSMCHSHVTGNLLANGEARRHGIDQTIEGLQLADRLGVGCTLHTLGRLSPEVSYDQAYGNAVTSLREIAPVADKLKIDLAIEFVWNGFAFSPLEMKQLIEDVASPRVGFYFDPGNMAVFHYPQHWARLLGPHIKMVHMKDWQGRPLNGGWTPLLEGDIDFLAVMRELRAAGYDGPLISEVSPNDATLEQTAQAIRRIATMG
ncbi:MAG: sugar phosphate isomerase/epimerase family protein [bacterium]